MRLPPLAERLRTARARSSVALVTCRKRTRLYALVLLSAALLPTVSLVEASKRVSGLAERLKISMPALDLLAFQLSGLLWLAEMRATVRSFPVAGTYQLWVRGKRTEKGGLAPGRNGDCLIGHLRESLGLTLSWETPVALEEGKAGMSGLWVEIQDCGGKIERTRIPSSQLDSATCMLITFAIFGNSCPSRSLGGRAQVWDGAGGANGNRMELKVVFSSR